MWKFCAARIPDVFCDEMDVPIPQLDYMPDSLYAGLFTSVHRKSEKSTCFLYVTRRHCWPERSPMRRVSPKRTVVLGEDVKPETITKLIESIRTMIDEAPEDWIQLNIMSPGGQVTTGFALYDYLKSTGVKLQTLALGHAHSMAVPLFLAGDHRVMAKRAIMLLHELSKPFQKEERLNVTQLRRQLDAMEHLQSQYIEVLADRTEGKLTRENALQLMETETILTAKQARKLGIAHEILSE